ncbi:hypothetical protein TNCV_1930271 [Trichonephila clavipes]|nr:hypothetical protein TNCV_1930271 [Trichonephila clavipes]
MQYHGVGRHHDQWPQAPTCGCEWDYDGQVAGRNYPPTIKNTLIRALTEEWDKLPQQLLDNVVQTICDPSLAIVQQCTSVRRVAEALDLPRSTVQKIMRSIRRYNPYKL